MAPRVSTYMSSPVYVVRPNDNLAYARNLMLKKGISRLVVVNEVEKPVGIITTTDIVETMYGSNFYKPLDRVYVSDVMTKELITIEENKSLRTAAHLMVKHKIGGLPVVNSEGKLVGIITRSDIARAYGEKYKGLYHASEVMRTDFPKASPTHSIYYILKLMESSVIRKVVIVDENDKVMGIVAKKDVAFAYTPAALLSARGKDRFVKSKVVDPLKDKIVPLRNYLVPVAEDIMTKDVITSGPEEDSAAIAKSMYDEGIGSIPIVDSERRVLGLVTKLDIVQLAMKIF